MSLGTELIVIRSDKQIKRKGEKWGLGIPIFTGHYFHGRLSKINDKVTRKVGTIVNYLPAIMVFTEP